MTSNSTVSCWALRIDLQFQLVPNAHFEFESEITILQKDDAAWNVNSVVNLG
jgi:hypothetical protein